MSKLHQSILIIILFTFSFSISAQNGDFYKLNYSATGERIITVSGKLKLDDSLLYMSQYSSKSDYFPKYIKNLKVSDKNGNPVQFQLQDSVRWILKDVKTGDIIYVDYDLHVNHEEVEWPGGIDGVAYARDYGIMTSGRALFVMNGKNKEDIEVQAILPKGYIISTPWKEVSEELNSFKVSNLENLQESFLFAGTHEEVIMNRSSFSLKFVLGGKTLLLQKQKIVNTANKLLDYYIELMGGIPMSAPGTTLDQCLVIITENDKIDGEVIGNHISMFMNPEGDHQTQMIGWFIFAHEFFHLWNGKSLQFEGTRSDWFKEGISNYYTLKGLNQVGFIDEEGYKTILDNLFYQRYINDPGLGTKSPVNSAEGFSKDNHWGLIYGGGLFAGIASDMEIRHHSSNEKSLDDLMRYFYKKYAGKNQFIDNEILKYQIEKFGFANYGDFYKDHLEGYQPISLDPYLKHAGAKVFLVNEKMIITPMQNKTNLQKKIWDGFLGSLE